MPHPKLDQRYSQLAEQLVELRKAQGLLQQELADRMRRSQTFVSKYESGARRIDLIELLEILQALDVRPHDFLDRMLEILPPPVAARRRR